MFSESVKPFVSVILHPHEDSENANGGQTVSGGIKYQTLFPDIIQGKYRQQHKASLGNAGISKHSFYTLLKYRRDISNDQCSCGNQRHRKLPLRMHSAESIFKQQKKSDEESCFYN